MIADIIKLLKDCGIKSVSIGAIIGFIGCVAVVFAGGDYRYMQKSEGQRIQLTQQYEIEDRLLVMDLREQGMSQAQIDAILKKRWEARLEAMNSGKLC